MGTIVICNINISTIMYFDCNSHKLIQNNILIIQVIINLVRHLLRANN